jgi:hypothetical protein
MKARDFLIFGFSISALLAGVAHSKDNARPVPPTRASNATSAPAYPAFFTKTCSQCHDYSVVTSQRHTPQEWSDIVDKMVDLGITAPDDKVAEIKGYLARTFPKK